MDPVIPTGAQAPSFRLPDLMGKEYSLDDMQGLIVVLNFWSAECTWCERVDHELISYLEPWKGKTSVWWIASNANEGIELIERVAKERTLPTVLLDTQQHVANLYGAQTTPHFFIVDRQGILAYQGAWDDITFRLRVATQTYVTEAIEALIENHNPKVTQTAPYGCALVRFFEGRC